MRVLTRAMWPDDSTRINPSGAASSSPATIVAVMASSDTDSAPVSTGEATAASNAMDDCLSTGTPYDVAPGWSARSGTRRVERRPHRLSVRRGRLPPVAGQLAPELQPQTTLGQTGALRQHPGRRRC